MSLLAGLNLGSSANQSTGGNIGVIIYSSAQVFIAVIAIAIIELICNPIITTRNEVILRLEAVRSLLDNEITNRGTAQLPPAITLTQQPPTLVQRSSQTMFSHGEQRRENVSANSLEEGNSANEIMSFSS